jgi:hypothetical protein
MFCIYHLNFAFLAGYVLPLSKAYWLLPVLSRKNRNSQFKRNY